MTISETNTDMTYCLNSWCKRKDTCKRYREKYISDMTLWVDTRPEGDCNLYISELNDN